MAKTVDAAGGVSGMAVDAVENAQPRYSVRVLGLGKRDKNKHSCGCLSRVSGNL